MDCTQTYLFGKRFRNRLFVGGLPLNTTAKELAEFFAMFSPVLEAKIIYDDQKIPKGYGFVTFRDEGGVKQVTDMGTLFLRNKKLNLGPAVKKEVVPYSNPELVVVTTKNMRGEYYLPATCSVPQNYQYGAPSFHPAGHGVMIPSSSPGPCTPCYGPGDVCLQSAGYIYQPHEDQLMQPPFYVPCSSQPTDVHVLPHQTNVHPGKRHFPSRRVPPRFARSRRQREI